MVELFASEATADLFVLEKVADEDAARARVEADEVAALVLIPPDFSERVFPQRSLVQDKLGIDLMTLDETSIEALSPAQKIALGALFEEVDAGSDDPVVVEVYASPDWRISASVIKGIVTQAIEMQHITIQGIKATMNRLVAHQLAQQTLSEDLDISGVWTAMDPGEETGIAFESLPLRLDVTSHGGRTFNWLDYFAVNLAVLFLMFAATSGGRNLLAEREWGTLPRLLVSPTPALTILLGKVGGVVLTGILQVSILWGATSLLGVYWGVPWQVVLAIVALVLCAASLGMLISAWSRTHRQADAIGTALTLVGAALSGSFFPRGNLPVWVQRLSLCVPNAWGIEIFSRLQNGAALSNVLPWLGGLLLLTVVYYAIALVGFRRVFV